LIHDTCSANNRYIRARCPKSAQAAEIQKQPTDQQAEQLTPDAAARGTSHARLTAYSGD
jgi:hypothetical protein